MTSVRKLPHPDDRAPTPRPFKQVDVFTAKPFLGNPVAVVLDATGLDAADMQRIARWTNLSETTFVLPPSTPAADYRLRIFTPGSELPFAGHPSVGSAHAIIEAGLVSAGKGTLVQECGAGLLSLEINDGPDARRIFITSPTPELLPFAAAHHAALRAALGASWAADSEPVAVHLGPTWLVVRMPADGKLARLQPDMTAVVALSRAHRLTGITAFARTESGEDAIHVRSFAPAEGVAEDPVCGSGNAAVGAYIAQDPDLAGLLPHYTARQGMEIGRDGRVEVRFADGRLRIGGQCVTCVNGQLVA